YKAEQLGYHSQIIGAGRKINDEMGKYVVSQFVKQIIQSSQIVKNAKVAIFGITFKENVSDVRNTKIIDIIKELETYGIEVVVCDPVARVEEVKREYDITLIKQDELPKINAAILGVPHADFLKKDFQEKLDNLFVNEKVIFDIKGVFDREKLLKKDYFYSSL